MYCFAVKMVGVGAGRGVGGESLHYLRKMLSFIYSIHYSINMFVQVVLLLYSWYRQDRLYLCLWRIHHQGGKQSWQEGHNGSRQTGPELRGDPPTDKRTAAAAAKSLQSCPTLYNPIDGSPPGSPVPRFSRQEYWSRVPLPSLEIIIGFFFYLLHERLDFFFLIFKHYSIFYLVMANVLYLIC